MPFITKQDVDISPTMPFVSSTAAQVSEGDVQKPAAVQGGTSSAAPALTGTADQSNKENEDTLMSGRGLQRSASLISEDSLSGTESDGETPGDDHSLKQNAKQRKQEREWLRHKRKAARQEARQAMEKMKRRKLGKAKDLVSSLLSTQERSRFETEIDANPIGSFRMHSRNDAATLMRGGNASEDADVFGVG